MRWRSARREAELKSYEFLFWAYNVIWLGLAGFLLYVFIRTRRVDRRLGRHEGED